MESARRKALLAAEVGQRAVELPGAGRNVVESDAPPGRAAIEFRHAGHRLKSLQKRVSQESFAIGDVAVLDRVVDIADDRQAGVADQLNATLELPYVVFARDGTELDPRVAGLPITGLPVAEQAFHLGDR